MTIASAYIKKRRKELNLTQEQLADEVGFSNTFISERESGIKRYNISHLNKLAIALKCSPKDFLPNEPFTIIFCPIFSVMSVFKSKISFL